jgi:hypothetical protein
MSRSTNLQTDSERPDPFDGIDEDIKISVNVVLNGVTRIYPIYHQISTAIPSQNGQTPSTNPISSGLLISDANNGRSKAMEAKDQKHGTYLKNVVDKARRLNGKGRLDNEAEIVIPSIGSTRRIKTLGQPGPAPKATRSAASKPYGSKRGSEQQLAPLISKRRTRSSGSLPATDEADNTTVSTEVADASSANSSGEQDKLNHIGTEEVRYVHVFDGNRYIPFRYTAKQCGRRIADMISKKHSLAVFDARIHTNDGKGGIWGFDESVEALGLWSRLSTNQFSRKDHQSVMVKFRPASGTPVIYLSPPEEMRVDVTLKLCPECKPYPIIGSRDKPLIDRESRDRPTAHTDQEGHQAQVYCPRGKHRRMGAGEVDGRCPR